MDDLDRFMAEMRVLAEAEAVLACAKLKVADERLAGDPELRQAMIEHFRRNTLRHSAQEETS